VNVISFVAFAPGIVGIVLLTFGVPALIKSLHELRDARRQRQGVAART
jgi:hypothetical protein